MILGVFQPRRCARSVEIYRDHILAGLRERRVTVEWFAPGESLPQHVDLYWDPAATGGRAPERVLRQRTQPLVMTIHGMASSAVPARILYSDLRSAIYGKVRTFIEMKIKWPWHDHRTIEIITVSEFAKRELETHLPFADARITPIYHGVDFETFYPASSPSNPAAGVRSFFLHASFHQPLKNLDRILEAYAGSGLAKDVSLVVVSPGLPRRRAPAQRGVVWILKELEQKQLAEKMRRALSFVFPSLRETFGLPVLEAMASGCPVITSRDSACGEVAGDAALLVDPRSVAEIRDALKRVAGKPELRTELAHRGLDRARSFSWERSVDAHYEVFSRVISPDRLSSRLRRTAIDPRL